MKPWDVVTRLLSSGAQPTPPASLSEMLQLTPAEIRAFRLGAKYHYRPFAIAKADGRTRFIHAPSQPLKRLQQRFLRHYLATQPVHPSATAYRRFHSNIKNAALHAWQQRIATVDLCDFFPNTTTHRVRGWLRQQRWAGADLAMLLRLCCYDGGLPQGAPTSPALSNLVNYPLDVALGELARESGAIYSRYADDLTFSWNHDHVPCGFQARVAEILQRHHYRIQPAKGWRSATIDERPEVTGIVLLGDGRLRMPWRLRWQRWRWRVRWLMGDRTAAAHIRSYAGYARLIGRHQGHPGPVTVSPPHAPAVVRSTPAPTVSVHDDDEPDEDIPF